MISGGEKPARADDSGPHQLPPLPAVRRSSGEPAAGVRGAAGSANTGVGHLPSGENAGGKSDYQIGDTVTVSCYNGPSKTYTVMGIVQDVQIGNSTHFFILPEEELSVLYPEISDFTGYVNLHTEQDSDQLRRAVFRTVSDQRVAVSGLDDLSAAPLLVQGVFSVCAVRYTRRLSLVKRIKAVD